MNSGIGYILFLSTWETPFKYLGNSRVCVVFYCKLLFAWLLIGDKKKMARKELTYKEGKTREIVFSLNEFCRQPASSMVAMKI